MLKRNVKDEIWNRNVKDEIWKLTNNIRTVTKFGKIFRIQEQWINDNGKTEWRNVETIDIKELTDDCDHDYSV